MRNALRFAREKGMEKLGVYKEARAYHQKNPKNIYQIYSPTVVRHFMIILAELKLKVSNGDFCRTSDVISRRSWRCSRVCMDIS